MTHFHLVESGVDVATLLAQLDAHPELWDAIDYRRTSAGTPHAQMQDIWVRYNDITPYKEAGDFRGFNDPHIPVWYPAIDALPAVREIAFAQMALAQAVMLGAVLITRIPPGGRIETHVDGGWHANYFNRKLYVMLRGNPKCINTCVDEAVSMQAGEVWTFNNLLPHGVVNDGDTERITLILCLRVE